jgi:hypothetical protein
MDEPRSLSYGTCIEAVLLLVIMTMAAALAAIPPNHLPTTRHSSLAATDIAVRPGAGIMILSRSTCHMADVAIAYDFE